MQPVNEQQETLQQNAQRLRIVWAALLFSQLFLLSLLYFMKNELFQFDFTQPIDGGNPVFVGVALALSMTSFVLSFVLRAQFTAQSVQEGSIGAYQTGLIVSLAMCESISLMGMLLALTQHYQYFFIWFAIAMLGMLLHFPKMNEIAAASFRKNI